MARIDKAHAEPAERKMRLQLICPNCGSYMRHYEKCMTEDGQIEFFYFCRNFRDCGARYAATYELVRVLDESKKSRAYGPPAPLDKAPYKIHPKKLQPICPYCGSRIVGYKVLRFTEMTSEAYYNCKNEIDCGGSYAVRLEIRRLMSPPMVIRKLPPQLKASSLLISGELLDYLQYTEVERSEIDEAIKTQALPQMNLIFGETDQDKAMREIFKIHKLQTTAIQKEQPCKA